MKPILFYTAKKIAKLRDNFIGNVIKHMPDFMSWQENEKISSLSINLKRSRKLRVLF